MTFLSNKSGHYSPSLDHLLQVIHQLEKKRVPFTFQVQVMNPALWYPNVAALLQQLALDEKPDYELAQVTSL